MVKQLYSRWAPKRERKRPDPLRLRWDLDDLPSSQHRAGLAGLAFAVTRWKNVSERRGVCEISALDARGLELLVDRDGMQSLFDDIYAASIEEVTVKARWEKLEPK